MANLSRWEPVRDFLSLRDAMDQMFDEMITNPENSMNLRQLSPAIDMFQTDDEVVIRASLPGMKSEDIKISITGDVLTMQGELQEESEEKKPTYHFRERRWGSFSRSISLPAPVKADKAKAEFEAGVLTLKLPKAEEVKPKTISVKAK